MTGQQIQLSSSAPWIYFGGSFFAEQGAAQAAVDLIRVQHLSGKVATGSEKQPTIIVRLRALFGPFSPSN